MFGIYSTYLKTGVSGKWKWYTGLFCVFHSKVNQTRLKYTGADKTIWSWCHLNAVDNFQQQTGVIIISHKLNLQNPFEK